MSKILHKADFDPFVNQTFQVHPESIDPLSMELFELTERNFPGQESFSVVFRGPKEPILPQMMYKLTHPEMGEFSLFLVPINYGKPDAIYYQSVFNRLLESEE